MHASEPDTHSAAPGPARQPVLFVPHGGGPWPAVEGERGIWRNLATHLRAIASSLAAAPRAVLAVTAHWEEAAPTLSAQHAPDLLYDYSGFPPHTYSLRYPAPGDPALAQRARELLDAAGFGAVLNTKRGLDHGVFIPLMMIFPHADVPVVALSLLRGLDPARHIALGAALAPLRDEGVLILASGMSYHNLRAFGGGAEAAAQAAQCFDDWLHETVVTEPVTRNARLCEWSAAPAARACHPREEHLLPLMVAAGAAGSDRGRRDFSDRVLGLSYSGFRFGLE